MKPLYKLILIFLVLPLMTGTISSFLLIRNLVFIAKSEQVEENPSINTILYPTINDANLDFARRYLQAIAHQYNYNPKADFSLAAQINIKLPSLLHISAIYTRTELVQRNAELERSVKNANNLVAFLTVAILIISTGNILFILRSLDRRLLNFKNIVKGEIKLKDIVKVYHSPSFRTNYVDSVLTATGDSLIFLDKTNKIIKLNQVTTRYLGYEELELIGVTIDLILNDINFDFAGQVVNNITTNYLKKDGTRLPISFSSSLLQDETGEIQGLICVARDISDRQKAEAENTLLSTAIEQVVEAIEITDTEAKFLYVNPAFEKITGYQRAEVIGKTSAALLRSGQHDRCFYENISNTLKNGQVWSGKYIGKRKDGKLYHQEVTISPVFNSSGLITHHVAVKRDITERQQLEERLAKINECFLSFTADPIANIQKLTTLGGELLVANCVLYYRLEDGVLTLVGQWRTTKDALDDTAIARICTEAIAQNSDEAFIVSDLANSKFVQSEQNILRKNWQTYIGQAVKCNNNQIGVTCALYEEKYIFSPSDRKILGIISAAIGVEEERRLTQQALRQSEERYALAELGANDGLWDWDLKSQEIYFSPRWKAMFGLGDKEMGNTAEEWFSRVHPEDIDCLQSAIAEHLEGKSSHLETECRILHQDGKERWMLVRGIAVKGSDGRYHRLAGSQTDITAKKAAEAQLVYESCHDSLTGLANRGLFMELLEDALSHAREDRSYLFAVLFLDLNRFKFINDNFGHLLGDRLLAEIARKLESCVRPEDTVARLGGDEFTILLDNIKDKDNAIQVAERLQAELAMPFTIDGNEIFASVSIGIALSSTGYKKSADILRDADVTMYRAKEQGIAAGYQIFDSTAREQSMARLQLEQDLRKAIAREEFVLYYQPIVSLKTCRISGFEALIRWQHPERGFISPVEFIPVAEATGLINPIGSWVLREACRQLKTWQDQFPGKQRLIMSANLSTKQFAQSDLIEQIAQILQETQLNSYSLKLEITESVLVENAAAVNAMLVQMQALGIRLSLDDFGTGYSSLSYMHSFPIDTLKIDRSFVNSVDVDLGKIEIIRTVVGLAWNLGMDTVAEGIETKKQMYQLKSLKCEYGQGYFFSRPLDAKAAEALIIAEREYFSRTSEVEPLKFWTKD